MREGSCMRGGKDKGEREANDEVAGGENGRQGEG